VYDLPVSCHEIKVSVVPGNTDGEDLGGTGQRFMDTFQKRRGLGSD